MLVSYNWLRNYVEIDDISPAQLAERLTRSGIEVDLIEERNQGVSKIVVGKVLTCEAHPAADRLHLCQVDVGEAEPYQIVCGAPNVAANQKVVVALPGAHLPGGIKIKKSKLRGVESQGMICSGDELGIDEKYLSKEEQEGILVLDDEVAVGTDAIAYLGLDDFILDLDLTPNRSDCLSMIGLGYEVAAILGRDVQLPQVDHHEEQQPAPIQVSVAADSYCPYYSARVIRGVKIQASPQWLKNYLIAAGIRPINVVVDITNYVMLEYGQPLHAFDYKKVASKQIHVRQARADEQLETLDDQVRKLDESMMVITDGERPIALAGVMGGANTEVDGETTDILLESALFTGISIRRTAQKLGLRSEASSRFEKGVDPNRVIPALHRATSLILQYAGGAVEGGVALNKPLDVEEKVISLRLSRLNQVLGTAIDQGQVEEYLRRLQFPYEVQGENILVTAPSRRPDISIEEDLFEEVARLYGYDYVPTTLPKGGNTAGSLNTEQRLTRGIHHYFAQHGLSEVITYSLSSPEEEQAFIDKEMERIALAMPLSNDRRTLRTTLLPSLLQVAQYNVSHQLKQLAMFEIGKLFFHHEQEGASEPYEERKTLAGILLGDWLPKGWNQGAEAVDFFLVKGLLEGLFAQLGIVGVTYEQTQQAGFHPGRTAKLTWNEQTLGVMGQLHPSIQKEKDLPVTYLFQLDLANLLAIVQEEPDYQPVPRYPAVQRDLALVVSTDVTADQMKQTIQAEAGGLLEEIRLFDLYAGKGVEDGKKSLAYTLLFRNREQTLQEEEVSTIIHRILEALAEKYGAQLRA